MSSPKSSTRIRQLPHDDVKFIINALRQASIKWPGRAEALDRARKKVWEGKRNKKTGKKILKFYWQCSHCEKWYRNETDVEVDHIVEVGPFCGDWNKFLARLFTTQDNLQVLCVVCHMKKTNAYNAAHLKWKRK